MSELREEILKAVSASKKSSLDRKRLAKALGLEKSSDFAALSRELDQMEEEFLLVRDRENRYETPEQAGYLVGRLSVNRKGLGYIDFDDRDSIVIEPEDQKDAMDGDTVVVKDHGSGHGHVESVVKRATERMTGMFSLTAHGLRCVPDDERIAQKEYSVKLPKDLHPIEGLRVLLHIERYEEPMRFSVERVIGHKDDPGVDILAILLDHDIEPEFPDAVMQEANAAAAEVSDADREGRRDLTGKTIVTIDGDDSKDFDDAVGVTPVPEGWQLKVCIADVAHYVKAGTALDQEAFRRGCSTYVVDRVVPMLPHVLSNGICSLNPHEIRLTNTCDMLIAKDGTVLKYELYPSVMRSAERMTYANVNRILEGDPELKERYAHLGDLFENLRDCADAIRAARVRRGAIDFDSTESVIVVDEKGHPTDVHARVQGHAEAMIEDCMIAANVSVADCMNRRNLPAVYRIHEEPQARRMKEFEQMSFLLGHKFVLPKEGVLTPLQVQQYMDACKDEEAYPVLSKLLLRCMQKAKYDPRCLGHFGLAEHEYLHFTSPIRRYPDLAVHRMLEKYVFGKCEDASETLKDDTFVQEASEQSSIRERESQDAEWAVDDMKKAEYMADRLGDQYEGIISSVTSFGFFVELSNTVEGLVRVSSLNDDYYKFDQLRYMLVGERTGKKYTIGMKVTVLVLAADKAASTVEFGLAKTGIRKADLQRGSFKAGRRSAPVRAGRTFSAGKGPRPAGSGFRGKPQGTRSAEGMHQGRKFGSRSAEGASQGRKFGGRPQGSRSADGARQGRKFSGRPQTEVASSGFRSRSSRFSDERSSGTERKQRVNQFAGHSDGSARPAGKFQSGRASGGSFRGKPKSDRKPAGGAKRSFSDDRRKQRGDQKTWQKSRSGKRTSR